MILLISFPVLVVCHDFMQNKVIEWSCSIGRFWNLIAGISFLLKIPLLASFCLSGSAKRKLNDAENREHLFFHCLEMFDDFIIILYFQLTITDHSMKYI